MLQVVDTCSKTVHSGSEDEDEEDVTTVVVESTSQETIKGKGKGVGKQTKKGKVTASELVQGMMHQWKEEDSRNRSEVCSCHSHND